MTYVFAILVILCIFAIPVLGIVFLIRWGLKKPKKKLGIALVCAVGGIIVFSLLGTATDPATWCNHEYALVNETEATCTEDGERVEHCDLCGRDDIEKLEATGHVMVEVLRKEPGEGAEGQVVTRCSFCGYEHIESLAALQPDGVSEVSAPPSSIPLDSSVAEPSSTIPDSAPVPEQYIPTQAEANAQFYAIWKAYKDNELSADDMYKGNRYILYGTFQSATEDGVLNKLNGTITVNVEIKFDDVWYILICTFDKSHRDDIAALKKGDLVCFEGECYSVGVWSDCEIIKGPI